MISRAPAAIRAELVTTSFVPAGLQDRFRDLLADRNVQIRTQVSIEQGRSIDLVVYVDNRPVIAIESKIAAAFQFHQRKTSGTTSASEEPPVYDHQLSTYGLWLAANIAPQHDWPGVIVLLTHRSPAPEGFAAGGEKTFGSTPHQIGWRTLSARIEKMLAGVGDTDTEWRFLAAELLKFLGERDMTATDLGSADISAFNLAMSRFRGTPSLFAEVAAELAHLYPNEINSRRKGSDNDPESSRVWGWSFVQGEREIYVAYGIYFPPLHHHFKEMEGKVGPHEQAFVAVGSDKVSIGAVADQAPSGWFGVADNWLFVKPVPLNARLDGERFPEFLVRSVRENIDDIRSLIRLFTTEGR